jgi:acyl-CoA synthetase (AMP-forming)/AMP-acid ligase II/acyl carrier protein
MPPRSLVDVLEGNRSVDRSVCYVAGETQERQISYGEIYERALGILYHLQAMGARRGDRIILFLGNNEQFLDGFWAAICGGMIPVPLAVGINDEHRHKLLRVARKLGKPFLYTDRKNLERLAALADTVGETALYAELAARSFLVETVTDIARHGKLHRPAADDLAMIQFSSGSTSEPRGVMLTHANLLSNSRDVAAVGRFCDADVSLSWMPLTHDMGLIGFYLMQFANQIHINLMPTDLFVRRPLLWLQLAARKRVTITCSPNFGYRHLLKVLGDRTLDGLDLSAIRLLYNGAEPISVQLSNEFLDRLGNTGLKRQAMYPVYGLAEASLAVTLPEPGSDFHWIRVDRHQLKVGAAIALNPADPRDALELMCVGRTLPATELRIVDGAREELPERHVGHILIRGASVTRGYCDQAGVTTLAIDANGWLDSGDLGVLHDAELYICGRSKEIIVMNGQNYYPYDLESIAQRAPGLELGKVVVTSVPGTAGQGEDLLVFVLHRGAPAEILPTALAVSRLITGHTGLTVSEVIPVARIPKTTSGKVQRHRLAQAYLDGEFASDLGVLRTLWPGPDSKAGDPADDLESELQRLCELALDGRAIDISDNLFELGASSLKLIEIHQNIDEQFPGSIDLTEIFDHPTIAQLAAHLRGKLATATPGPQPGIALRSRGSTMGSLL